MDIGTHDATATAIGRHKVDAQALVRRRPPPPPVGSAQAPQVQPPATTRNIHSYQKIKIKGGQNDIPGTAFACN